MQINDEYITTTSFDEFREGEFNDFRCEFSDFCDSTKENFGETNNRLEAIERDLALIKVHLGIKNAIIST